VAKNKAKRNLLFLPLGILLIAALPVIVLCLPVWFLYSLGEALFYAVFPNKMTPEIYEAMRKRDW